MTRGHGFLPKCECGASGQGGKARSDGALKFRVTANVMLTSSNQPVATKMRRSPIGL